MVSGLMYVNLSNKWNMQEKKISVGRLDSKIIQNQSAT